MTIFYKHVHHPEQPRTLGVTLMADVQGKFVTMSWAVCSELDNFCRQTGREIAEQNMRNGRVIIGYMEDGVSVHDNLLSILHEGNNLKDVDRMYWKKALKAVEQVETEKAWDQHIRDAIRDFGEQSTMTFDSIQRASMIAKAQASHYANTNVKPKVDDALKSTKKAINNVFSRFRR